MFENEVNKVRDHGGGSFCTKVNKVFGDIFVIVSTY